MNTSTTDKIKLARLIAWIAAAFSLMVAVLLIANFAQTKLNDPIDNKTIPALVKQLSQDPSNESLKAEIRAFDLMARKAYFTSQWQLRTGSYLLLLGVIILILAVRYILAAKSKLNDIDSIDKVNGLDQLVAQKWVIYVGSGLIVLALTSGFLSYNSLKEYMVNENIVAQETQAAEPAVQATPVSATPPVSGDSSSTAVNTPVAENAVAAEVPVATASDAAAAPAAAVPAGFPSTAELKANYPFFRGPEGNGVAYQKNTPIDWNGAAGKNVLWKVKVPKAGFSSPVIWGNQLFVTGADAQSRVVYCYDKNTGKLMWEAAADNIQGSPAKMPKVNTDTGLAAPTMATNGRAVFAIFATGDVLALDMAGKRLWARNLGVPDNHYGHSSSLILYKDKLLVQYDTNKAGKLIGLNTATGETAWETVRSSKISWSSPILVNTGNHMELILTTNPNVNGYNPETGKELWNIACLSGEVGPSAGYSDGMVFAANEYAKLVGIKIGGTPEVVWEADEFLPEVSSPLAVNGLLYVATTYGVFACYDAKSGEKLWSQEYGDAFYSSPVYADGKVYITDMSGKTRIVKATKDYQLVSTAELGEKAVCSPVFADNRVYLRGMNQLYCLGSK
ncbi:MAG TPA: PQQ-binding-like beta-propeller repeat protein [Prolixibacteraceae bacterium]|nr:PQQ-binding-like beta-propeller repeat protein [Prolixibacteraceae bacterium]